MPSFFHYVHARPFYPEDDVEIAEFESRSVRRSAIPNATPAGQDALVRL